MPKKAPEVSDIFENIARDTLESMSGILPCPLAVSNLRGIIIISSSPSYILGTTSPLCLKVMDTAAQKNIRDVNEECESSDRTGVAVPLRNACLEVIGAVAALGRPEESRPYALALKRQIEFVLRTEHRIQSDFLKESAIQDVISDFVNYIPGVDNLELLENRARFLGFSPDFLYVPIVFDMHNFRAFIRESWKEKGALDCREAESFIQSVKNKILLETRRVFNAPDDVSVPLNGDKYAVFCSVSPKIRWDRERVFRRVNENSHQLLRKLEEEHLSAVLGIGFFFEGVSDLSYAYRSALEAVRLGKLLFRQPGVYDIQNLRVEALLLGVSEAARKRFVMERFTQFDLDPGDDELKKTIIAYGKNFFNRQSTADDLHIHRNTLNYRLKKIEDRTQKSLRSFRSYIELYMACILADIQASEEEQQQERHE